jgi:hypothetical protein
MIHPSAVVSSKAKFGKKCNRWPFYDAVEIGDDTSFDSRCEICYPPHKQAAYSRCTWPANMFPLATAIANEVLSLPICLHLSLEDADQVIATIRNDL